MSPTIRHKYKYFHSTVQRAKDRRQKFHFCRLSFDVRPRNAKLNLSIDNCYSNSNNGFLLNFVGYQTIPGILIWTVTQLIAYPDQFSTPYHETKPLESY